MSMAARRLERIVTEGHLDSASVARVLDKSHKTVVRWLRHEVEPRWESEQRLRELEAVLDRLQGVVEPAAAREWLFTPVPMLDYEIPANLVRDGEFRRVIGAIDAIGEGAFV